MTPKGDGMPPQEQEEGACDCPFHREPEWREPECDCGSGYAHRRADCTVPKPSPAVEEGPAGGEARCLDDLTYSKGYQRGLEAGEKGMRERAALLVWPSYAAAIRALPLSVADGPAPAKEEGSSFPSKAEFTETYFKSPAPSPPTAEERVEPTITDHAFQPLPGVPKASAELACCHTSICGKHAAEHSR